MNATQINAWPNQAEAARLLGVDAATLLRRELPFETFGGKEKRFAPSVVMEQALHFKRVPAQQVAAGLYEIALLRAGREQAKAVGAEVERFLMAHAELKAKPLAKSEFLAEARRILPQGIYLQVKAVYEQKPRPASMAKVIKSKVKRIPAQVAASRKRSR